MYQAIENASDRLTVVRNYRECQQCTSCSHYNRGPSRTELNEKGCAAALDRAESEISYSQSNSRC
jgi:hypothetical protein